MDKGSLLKCRHCGGEKLREHAVNEYQERLFVQLREDSLNELKEVAEIGSNHLEDTLLAMYFCPRPKWKSFKLLGVIKQFCVKLLDS